VMAACFRAAGMDVRERFGPVHRFDKTPVILGCHIVGERAVELAQVAAVAIAAEMTVEQMARLPLSFPTYTNVLGRAVFDAARQLGIPGFWDVPDATAAST